jgi:head-tail adaptor
MIGAMDQVVEPFAASFVDDGFGGREESLLSLGQMWAKVEFLSGEEREHAMRNADKQSVKFTMHNFDNSVIGTTSVIVWNGVKYDVVEPSFDGNQRLYVSFVAVAGELNG